MATLLEYFNNDFKGFSLDQGIAISGTTTDVNTGEKFEFSLNVKLKILHNYQSSGRFLGFYIPESHATMEICDRLIESIETYKDEGEKIQILGTYSGDKTIGIHKSVYTNRIYIYSESQLSSEQLKTLEKSIDSKKLFVTFRSMDYVNKVELLNKPMAFISHDSRDKDLIARPLAQNLHSKTCFVWYDEYSLKIGDRLRESIEKGIKEAKKCILILTPNFLSNPGWTKVEFNSIFTREVLFQKNIVLPIWHNVSRGEIYEYSPSLVDIVAEVWPDKEKLTSEEYNKKTEELLSRLHVVIIK